MIGGGRCSPEVERTAERVGAARQHLLHSLQWKGPKLGVLEMRRHYTNYFKGFPGIKEYRSRLVTEEDPSVLLEILGEIAFVYANDTVYSEVL